jgi:hypothetical protein
MKRHGACASPNQIVSAGANFASEAGHWYDKTGKPCYEVPYADPRKGMRPTTIRDARKLGLVPSVTMILKKWDAPALNTWRERQVFDATFAFYKDCPFNLELITSEELELHWKDIQAQSQKPREKAADRGHALHTAIEKWLSGKPYDAAFQKHIDNIHATLARGYNVLLGEGAPEKSFAHRMGFGGRVDWHKGAVLDEVQSQEGLNGIVLDFKTKDKIEKDKKYGYINHYAQLAAYRVGLGIPTARGLNVFVGAEDAEVVVLEWVPSDMQSGWQFFINLLGAWKIDNHYYPKL